MDIAFCYENVLPTRGGCETYIGDLSRRLLADGHQVHLYACRWDAGALPERLNHHAIPPLGGPRFLRPWRFARRCLDALAGGKHDVTVGFDKTFGLDVLYPQGGLHAASHAHNLLKYAHAWQRGLVCLLKGLDPAHRSFTRLEREQYLGKHESLVVVNSFMVRDHFQRFYGIGKERLHVVRSAIDPARFPEHDRPKLRLDQRSLWGIAPEETVGLIAAMNYRLKGLDPLLHALALLLARPELRRTPPRFRLLVVGSEKNGRYRRMARRLGIADQVLFAGHCPEMRRAYFAADFLVHPTFYDPCSLVVLEALACGLPVITTKYNGASEVLTPLQEGYVVTDPHDHEQLAWALAQLLDPQRRHACALAARRTAATWTFEHHYRQLLAVFTEAARRKRAA